MAKMPWFKVYHEIIHDPKIRRLTTDERWLWIVLLSLGAASDERGVIAVTEGCGYTCDELAGMCICTRDLRKNEHERLSSMVNSALKRFTLLNMIDVDQNGVITLKNFEKRQDSHLSDSERASRYRQKKKVTNVTLDKEGEGDKDNTPLPPKGALGGFEKFWKVYPNKKSKQRALKAWRKLNPNEQLTEKILQAVSKAKTSEQWRKDSGKFIPHPATWLNGGCWDDEITGQAVKPTAPRFHEAWKSIRAGIVTDGKPKFVNEAARMAFNRLNQDAKENPSLGECVFGSTYDALVEKGYG